MIFKQLTDSTKFKHNVMNGKGGTCEGTSFSRFGVLLFAGGDNAVAEDTSKLRGYFLLLDKSFEDLLLTEDVALLLGYFELGEEFAAFTHKCSVLKSVDGKGDKIGKALLLGLDM